MSLSTTPKTINIVNDTANDGTVVDQMLLDLYTNDATIASYINEEVVLKTGPNTFTETQTFPTKAVFSAGVNLGALTNPATPVIGDMYYDNTLNGFIGVAQIGIIATVTNASPIVVGTLNPHGLTTGNNIFIAGVLGTTAANGYWTVTVVDSSAFSLNSSTGNAAYTSGGIVSTSDQVVTARNFGAYPTRHHGSPAPIWASATTMTVSFIQERDSLDQVNIAKVGSTTINTATAGLNGMAQSTLSGTVSVNAASATVTFSVSQADLQVGDVIVTAGGQARRLASGSGTSWTAASNFSSLESAVTCKRGGIAATTYYYLYAASNGVTPGLLLSTRNVMGGDTLVDLPSGYIWSRQLAFAVKTDSSANLIPFTVMTGWPKRPKIILDVDPNSSPWQVLSAGTSVSFVALDCSAIVPAVAVAVDLNGSAIHNSTSGYGQGFLRPGGSSSAGRIIAYTGAPSNNALTNTINIADFPLSSSKTIEYRGNGTNGPQISFGVTGFTVEVN